MEGSVSLTAANPLQYISKFSYAVGVSSFKVSRKDLWRDEDCLITTSLLTIIIYYSLSHPTIKVEEKHYLYIFYATRYVFDHLSMHL